MNIFVLSVNPQEAARMQFDKHIVKMALETAQILSTINGGPYKPTHQNHPCVLWAAEALENYKWLVKHGIAICEEYTYRFNKRHKCQDVIESLHEPLVCIPQGCTPWVLCMPEQYKLKYLDGTYKTVESYREYYKSKASFANWTKRNKPDWWPNVQSSRTISIDPRTISVGLVIQK
jgi:hypothetical protein